MWEKVCAMTASIKFINYLADVRVQGWRVKGWMEGVKKGGIQATNPEK